MDKKIYNCFLPWIVLFNVFTCALQMNGMLEPTSKEILRQELPTTVAQELLEPITSLSKDKVEELKKEVVEAKNVARKIIIQKNIENGKNNLKPNSEIYLYDEKTGKGSIFESKLIPMSVTLTNNLFDRENVSAPIFVSYPVDIIKILHNIFTKCVNFRGKEEYAETANAMVKKELQSIENFSTLVSVANFVHYLDVDKEIKNPFIKKIQEKTDILFDENRRLPLDELKMLHTLNIDLLQEIVSVKWDIFLEKMRFSIAKNKKMGSKPSFHTYSGPLNAVENIIFNPNQTRLLITTYELPASLVQPSDISCIYVINTDGTVYRKLVEVTHNVVWIDNDTFAYIEYDETLNEYSSLNVFNCTTEKLTKVPLGNGVRDIKKIIFNDNKIMFLYRNIQLQDAVAMCDVTELKTIDYTSFDQTHFFLANDIFPLVVNDIFALENDTFILIGSPTGDRRKTLYELQGFSAKPIPIIQLSDEATTLGVVSVDRKKLAWELRDKNLSVKEIAIYSFETKQQIKCTINNKYVYKLQFDVQGKILLVGCKEELLILSAITGEKICEFKYSDNQAFEKNWSLALSSDGNRLVIGANGPLQTTWQMLNGILVPNVLTWELVPNKYVPVWTKLIQKKQLPMSQKILLPSLYYRSSEGKKPVILTPGEKESFHAIDPNVQQLFTDIRYVAPGQTILQADKPTKTQPLKEAGSQMLKFSRNYWNWLKTNFSWDSLMKYFPNSG